jgi:bifunctional non-homologous end joining protein LigD
MHRFDVMLASPSKEIAETPEAALAVLQRRGYSFEFKWDGIRALILLTEGTVRVINRRCRDITYRYPDLVDALSGLGIEALIDGEIVVLDENGCSDFAAAHRRDAQGNIRSARQLAQAVPVQFAAFDILELNGEDMRLSHHQARHALLYALQETFKGTPVVFPPTSKDGAAMWQLVQDRCLEGLIAKSPGSSYTPGRRAKTWVKIKRTSTITALVCGYEPGEGSRAPYFGALHLALLDEDGRLCPVGKVGSGFTDADLVHFRERLDGNDHPIMVEVKYLEVSPQGQLRMPVFVSERTDIDPTACTFDQL